MVHGFAVQNVKSEKRGKQTRTNERNNNHQQNAIRTRASLKYVMNTKQREWRYIIFVRICMTLRAANILFLNSSSFFLLLPFILTFIQVEDEFTEA